MLANDDAMLQAPGDYPILSVRAPTNPSRLWAFPIVAFWIKVLILIPVATWWSILALVAVVTNLLNSFVVLFSGRYWVAAYGLAVGLLRLQTKIWMFATGLTDQYPGFGLTITPYESFTLDVPLPESPSRGFAIPVLGGFARGILLIPFALWGQVVAYGAYLAVVVASFPVLFTGQYPPVFLELARDALRVSLARVCYGLGLSDTYPSFAISMEHPRVKWLFIILGILCVLLQVSSQGAPNLSGMQ